MSMRYLCGDTQTVSGLTAYKLATPLTGTQQQFKSSYTSTYMKAGIRVWKRSAGGVETEITAGSPVAVASYTALFGGAALVSAAWSCPRTPLAPTDSVVVRVYIQVGVNPWELAATFTTEQLGAGQLDAATWTVYYYLGIIYDPETKKVVENDFTWANPTYPCYIEGFSWSTSPKIYGTLDYAQLKTVGRTLEREGAVIPINVSASAAGSTRIYLPPSGKAAQVLGWSFVCDADVVCLLRFATSGNVIAGLTAKGAHAMNLIGLAPPQGAANESIEIYVSGAANVKGFIVVKEV